MRRSELGPTGKNSVISPPAKRRDLAPEGHLYEAPQRKRLRVTWAADVADRGVTASSNGSGAGLPSSKSGPAEQAQVALPAGIAEARMVRLNGEQRISLDV